MKLNNSESLGVGFGGVRILKFYVIALLITTDALKQKPTYADSLMNLVV